MNFRNINIDQLPRLIFGQSGRGGIAGVQNQKVWIVTAVAILEK